MSEPATRCTMVAFPATPRVLVLDPANNALRLRRAAKRESAERDALSAARAAAGTVPPPPLD